MPLNKKGKKIKKAMTKQYGKKKGEKVFYAMENSGKLKKVKKLRGGGADMGGEAASGSSGSTGGGGGRDAGMGMGGKSRGSSTSSSSSGGGRNPSKQYETKTNLSPAARQALQNQRDIARGRISPSTTVTGNVLKGIGVLGFGIPPKVTGRMIDKSPMAFGVPKSTKTKQATVDTSRDSNDRGDNITVKKSPIISGPVKTLDPIETKPLVSPSGAFNYTVGLKKGGMLRQGKPKLAKKGWK